MKKRTTAQGRKISRQVCEASQRRMDRIAMQPQLLALRDRVKAARATEKRLLGHFSEGAAREILATQQVDLHLSWRELDAVLKLLGV